MFVKAFRLFISSTFADFTQERELLQTQVFPALDAHCSSRGYQFLPLDLRWGVNNEAQLDQRTAEICLAEVRAAKGYPPPNFLIMVGNRYGWVPLPYAIASDEFEAVAAWLESQGRRQDMLTLAALYQLDENHLVHRGRSAVELDGDRLVGAYTLRSREEIPELKPAEAWARSEARARRVLQESADALLRLGEIDASAHEKYFLSLTEQEIIHGFAGYRAGGKDAAAPAPALESTDGPQATVFFREINGTGGGPQSPASVYIEHEPRLEELKTRLRQMLPDGNIVSERGVLDESDKLDATYLARFGAAIQRKLEAAIDRHVALVSAAEQAPDAALRSERAAHEAFAAQRRRVFVGREPALRAIASFIVGDDEFPLIVHGRSGLGKSALMARALADAAAAQGAPVMYRFVGASAASSDLRSLLMSLVEDLAAHGILTQPQAYDGDIHRFCGQIQELISSITAPVTIFLDALDQLRKPYRLDWLPARLPAIFKLVISTLSDEAYEADSAVYRNLRQRFARAPLLAVEPLSSAQGRDMLRALEQDAGRGLQENQRDYVIGRFEQAGASPLYLKTAFEIARGWRSTDVPGEGGRVLAGDTAALIARFMHDLSAVYHHEVALVTRVLGCLAAARNGLSEKELTEILSRDAQVMRAISSEQHGFRTSKLPASVWVRLNRHLAPFLIEKQVDDQLLLQFFHRQVADVAREHHYEAVGAALHRALADYFESRAVAGDGGTVYEKRSLSELPYQLHHCRDAGRLGEVLMSPDWMQQKLAAFGPHLLAEDYQYAFTEGQRLVGRTLQLVAGILTRDGRQLLPQLIGRLMAVADDELQELLQRARPQVLAPAILPLRPSLLPPGAEIARFDGYDFWGRTLVALPGNRVATAAITTIRILHDETGEELFTLGEHKSAIRTMALLNEHSFASAGGGIGLGDSKDADCSIWIWDLDSLERRHQFRGHTLPVNAIVALAEDRCASASEDGTIRIWDLASGDCLLRIDAHAAFVNALAVLPGGHLASGSDDGTIRLWDIGRGSEVGRLVGHVASVTALAALPDGRLASGSRDSGIVRIWDLDTGVDDLHLPTRTESVSALAVLPDGRLVSGCQDGTLCFWSTETMTETARLGFENRPIGGIALLPRNRLAFRASGSRTIHVLDTTIAIPPADNADGHDEEITALCVLPGSRVASGSADRAIKIWDAPSCRQLAKLTGHRDAVTALAALPDDRLASGSADESICVWNLAGCSRSKTLEGAAQVRALLALPDGRLASGGSDGIIRLWDLDDGREFARLEGHAERITALAMHPDGRLVSGAAETIVRFWDPASGRETGQLELFTARGMAVAPDGRLILGHTPSFVLYDARDGTQGARFAGHKAEVPTELAHVRSIALLPTGFVASAASDNSVRIWHPDDAREVACLEVDGRITCLIALADGRLVAGDVRGRLHWLGVVWAAGDGVRLAPSADAERPPVGDGGHAVDRPAAGDPDTPGRWQLDDADQEELNRYQTIYEVRQSAERHEAAAGELIKPYESADAVERLEQAIADRKRVVEIAPDGPLWRQELAEARGAVGWLFECERNFAEAFKAYKSAEDIHARMSVASDRPARLLQAWNEILNRMGRVQAQQLAFNDALPYYENIARNSRLLLAADPESIARREGLACDLLNVAHLRKFVGKASLARDAYDKAGAMLAALLSRDPGNGEWQERLRGIRAALDELERDPDGAMRGDRQPDLLTVVRDSLAVAEWLAALDPGSAGRELDVAVLHETLGDTLLERGEAAEALASYDVCLIHRRLLTDLDPIAAGAPGGLIGVHGKMAGVWASRGLPGKAAECYRAALALAEPPAAADPANARLQHVHMLLLRKLGDAQVAQGDAADGLRSLGAAMTIAGRLANSDPDDADRRQDLAASYERIGDVLGAHGSLSEALDFWRDGLAIRDRLAAADPGNAGRQRELANSHYGIGDALTAQGNPDEALTHFRVALEIRDRLAEIDPDDPGLQYDLALAHVSVGDMQKALRDFDGALASYRDNHAILERLLKFNAENVGLQRDLAAACGRIGTMQTLQGDLAGGLQSFEDCHALISRVAESDPRNIDWQSDRAVSHLKLAVGYMETKELLRALVAAESGRAIMLELLAQDPDQADWQRTLARFDQVIAALREM